MCNSFKKNLILSRSNFLLSANSVVIFIYLLTTPGIRIVYVYIRKKGMHIMRLVTQIGGYDNDRELVLVLKRRLQKLHITVTHPAESEPSLGNQDSQAADTAAWQPYEAHLDYFTSIARSDVHITYNAAGTSHGTMENATAREIAYAMLKRKPIVLLYPPKFEADVDTFFKNLIEESLNKLMVCDLTILDVPDIKRLLRGITKSPVNYGLTNQEAQVIERHVRQFFRELVYQGVERVP